MGSIIASNKTASHIVNKYNFKSLDFDEDDFEQEQIQKPAPAQASSVQEHRSVLDGASVDSGSMSSNSKDSLIESLLKKTDDMTSNFIKLQMKLENMTEEHKVEIANVKKNSFDEGVLAGKTEALKSDEKKLLAATEQFLDSMLKLQKSAKDFDGALESIKKELVAAAVDIAREVIRVELSQNSSDIAEVLSNELISDLQSASKITLRVNPRDHGTISQRFQTMSYITVVSDGAVSQGGVVAISDAGNIDAQVSKRFDRVKKAALSE